MSDQATAIALQTAIEAKLTFLGRNGPDWDYVCPFCAKNGQTHTLHVRYETAKSATGVAVCHSCDWKTKSLLRLVQELYGAVPRRFDVLVRSAAFLQDVEDILFDDSVVVANVGLPKSFVRLGDDDTKMSRRIQRYLEGRGFTLEELRRFRVGYFSDRREKAYGYAIFPFKVNNRCVYWQGRRVVGSGPKSYNPPATDKKSFLFGQSQAVGCKTGFLVEGPLDAIAWGPGGLALTSKVLQPAQIRMLALLELKRLVVCLDGPKDDGSDDAYDETKEIAERLAEHLSCRIGYILLRRGDPADNKDRLRRIYTRSTVWLPRHMDFVEKVQSILQ